ncbi:endoglucanase 1 [Physcomitrium patens]|uniref:endoglucanase 1 n=1 Tax=Physcomitrium patens TaxID=3218 RepID=UPI003CCE39A4
MYPNLLLNFTPTFSYIWASYIADCDVQVDLTGGYHDAGDNVKFGLPMAFSLTMLSWGVVEFRDALRRTGQLGNTLNAIRWGTDYLLKASTGPNELWVQVGDPNTDHNCWQRPEESDPPRTSYKVDANRPGSDVAGETAAALAAASIAFRGIDNAYSDRVLARARRVFDFADRYRGKYSDVLGGEVCPFYCSYSGYQDELVWGAAWLYKATLESGYLQYLYRNGNSLGGTTTTVNAFSWDNKYAGAQILLAQFAFEGVNGLQGYKNQADGYICSVLPRSISQFNRLQYSPGGMPYYMINTNMQYVTSSSFLLTTYAKYLSAARRTVNCGGRQVTAATLISAAQSQVDYILGRNPRGLSYMVGFGRYPTRVHHRAASMPSMRTHPRKIQCLEGFNWFHSWNSNPNVAMGAIVGGPNQNDDFDDARQKIAQTEPALYVNSPIVGVLSELAVGRRY